MLIIILYEYIMKKYLMYNNSENLTNLNKKIIFELTGSFIYNNGYILKWVYGKMQTYVKEIKKIIDEFDKNNLTYNFDVYIPNYILHHEDVKNKIVFKYEEHKLCNSKLYISGYNDHTNDHTNDHFLSNKSTSYICAIYDLMSKLINSKPIHYCVPKITNKDIFMEFNDSVNSLANFYSTYDELNSNSVMLIFKCSNPEDIQIPLLSSYGLYLPEENIIENLIIFLDSDIVNKNFTWIS